MDARKERTDPSIASLSPCASSGRPEQARVAAMTESERSRPIMVGPISAVATGLDARMLGPPGPGSNERGTSGVQPPALAAAAALLHRGGEVSVPRPFVTRPPPAGSSGMRPALVYFAKAPRPGLVKTRLSPPLSPEAAATLYAAMLRDG